MSMKPLPKQRTIAAQAVSNDEPTMEDHRHDLTNLT